LAYFVTFLTADGVLALFCAVPTDLTKWLEARRRSPRGVIQRQKIREILGMGVWR